VLEYWVWISGILEKGKSHKNGGPLGVQELVFLVFARSCSLG
jgi:hypothetical protein